MRVVRTLLCLSAAGLVATLSAAAPGFRLVTHAANPSGTISRPDAARLFLKKAVHWPNGRPALVIDQDRVSPVRQAFSRGVHQKDAEAIVSYWQTLVFAGRDVPPPVAKSDEEVLSFVRANPGALGYVSETASLEGVKAVTLR